MKTTKVKLFALALLALSIPVTKASPGIDIWCPFFPDACVIAFSAVDFWNWSADMRGIDPEIQMLKNLDLADLLNVEVVTYDDATGHTQLNVPATFSTAFDTNTVVSNIVALDAQFGFDYCWTGPGMD